MRRLLTLAAFSLLAACSSGAASDSASPPTDDQLNESKALGMTDVTILYPMSKNMDFFDDYMGPSSEDARGELLPAEAFQQLLTLKAPPMLDWQGHSTDPQRALFASFSNSFPLLRVVGVRLDPCFGEVQNLGATTCKNTIRLVAQFFSPRSAVGDRMVPDGSASIHLIYEVSRDEFTTIAKSMLALRQASGLPLQKDLMTTTGGTHPTISAEGVRGPYATALNALVLKYAGEQNLTQVAFCVQDRGAPVGYYGNNGTVVDSRWVFGRVSYSGGRLAPLEIATLGYDGLQTVDSSPSNATRDHVVVAPPSVLRDNFLQTFNQKPEANGQLDPAKAEAARRAAHLLQNPTAYSTNASDCASCHMAKQATANTVDADLDYKSFTFRLDHTNDLVGPFRHFGYDSGAQPIVSTRIANETALVLDYLNKVVLH